MRALLSKAPGGPETLVLDELPDPVAGPGQVLVAVKACSINYPDVLIIEDKYQFKPARPFAPGGEIAGIVEHVGDGVTEWKAGDRVIGMVGHGGLVEKVVVEASKLYALPEGRSFAEGAALILTYGTTIHALLDRGHIAAGQTLLVLGAAGGVGLAAIELGKAFGARVVAAVSSDEKAAVARDAGADETIVYAPRPVRPRPVQGAGRTVQGGGRQGRLRRHLRSGRWRLCRTGVALDRVGRPLSRRRLPGRHPQAAAQPDVAEIVRCLRRVLGGLRGRATRRRMRRMSLACSTCGRTARSRRVSPRPSRSRMAARRSPRWPRARRSGSWWWRSAEPGLLLLLRSFRIWP